MKTVLELTTDLQILILTRIIRLERLFKSQPWREPEVESNIDPEIKNAIRDNFEADQWARERYSIYE